LPITTTAQILISSKSSTDTYARARPSARRNAAEAIQITKSGSSRSIDSKELKMQLSPPITVLAIVTVALAAAAIWIGPQQREPARIIAVQPTATD